MRWQETKQDTEKHSKDCLRDTLAKLQAEQDKKESKSGGNLFTPRLAFLFRRVGRQPSMNSPQGL